jgi:manganese transport system ATP-binding protein
MFVAEALSIQNLQVSYAGQLALKNVSLQVKTGSFSGIIGPNGAGKSTLLKAIIGLIPAKMDQLKILGKALRQVRKSIAYVPQRNDIDWDFPIQVLDTVLLGCYPRLGLFKRPKKQDRDWAYACLERVGMEKYSKQQIGQLSGGQQQRVFLARALAQRAELLLLDEPFVGVDVASEQTMMYILKELQQEGKTILVVHHDLHKAHAYFDELILLNKSLIAQGEVSAVLAAETIEAAYGNPFSVLQEVGVTHI